MKILFPIPLYKDVPNYREGGQGRRIKGEGGRGADGGGQLRKILFLEMRCRIFKDLCEL